MTYNNGAKMEVNEVKRMDTLGRRWTGWEERGDYGHRKAAENRRQELWLGSNRSYGEVIVIPKYVGTSVDPAYSDEFGCRYVVAMKMEA